MERVYHWYQLADDIAAANDLTTGSQLKMATELSLAIHAGAVQCWKENGDPIRGAIPLTEQRLQRPHLTAAEGNNWLFRNEYLQNWVPVDSVVQTATAGSDCVVPTTIQPLPLKTRTMAESFSGLHWNCRQWLKKLGNKPAWLDGCLVLNRARGEGSREWNPVRIGAYLVEKGHAKQNSVRSRFQTTDLLKPWLDEWKTYEANYLYTD